MRLVDADTVSKLFDAEFKETIKLICEGETHLDNLAEGFCEAYRVIQNMPTVDAVPVVRCRECKHHRVLLGRDLCAKNAVVFDGNESGLKITGENDYCFYGERKENNEVD